MAIRQPTSFVLDVVLPSTLVLLFITCWLSVSAAPMDGHGTVRQINQTHMPGGYFPANLTDPDVKRAFKFANSTLMAQNSKIKRVEAISAEIQIVAGTNVKLSLRIYNSLALTANGKRCKVIVFIPLPHTNSTLRLKQSNCII